MLITQKDVDKLKSLDFHPFKFIYNNTETYDKTLHNKVIQFFKSKSLLAPYEKDLVKNKLECLIFKEKDKEYQEEFFNSFVGQDINELTGFFINYNTGNIPNTFKNKDILIMDKSTRSYYFYLRNEISASEYANLKSNDRGYSFDSPKFLIATDLNSLYKHHERVFLNVNKDKLYQDYQKNIKKWKVQYNVDSYTTFSYSLAGMIVYKRPVKELEDFFSVESNLENLRHPHFSDFYKSLDKSVMPKIVEMIDFYKEKSRTFEHRNIDFIEKSDLRIKVVEINLEKLLIKHQLDEYICINLIENQLKALSKVLNLEDTELDHLEENLVSITITGNDNKVQLCFKLLSDIINDTQMFQIKNGKQLQQYFTVNIEKHSIISQLGEIGDTKKAIINKI